MKNLGTLSSSRMRGTDSRLRGNDNKAVGIDNKAVGIDNKAVGNDNTAVGNDNTAVSKLFLFCGEKRKQRKGQIKLKPIELTRRNSGF